MICTKPVIKEMDERGRCSKIRDGRGRGDLAVGENPAAASGDDIAARTTGQRGSNNFPWGRSVAYEEDQLRYVRSSGCHGSRSAGKSTQLIMEKNGIHGLRGEDQSGEIDSWWHPVFFLVEEQQWERGDVEGEQTFLLMGR